MSKQTINIGASPNDGTGTPLRTSFDYTNQNFTEIYTALGGGVALPGATTQVIFNDGGTNLAGDAGLVYNKTTDALTVAGLVTAGSATITGAATVGTTLGVTGASTLASATITGLATVGTTFAVGTVTPDIFGRFYTRSIGFDSSGTTALQINGTSYGGIDIGAAGVRTFSLTSSATDTNISTVTNIPIYFNINSATKMTLNTAGNLAFPSGKGIDFSAVTGGTGTATANVLADYEEGTWTGTLTGSTTNPTVPVTATGRYTKIGRVVTVQITYAGVDTTGASGGIAITGLPFANTSAAQSVGTVSLYQIGTFTGSTFAIIDSSSSSIELNSNISGSVYGVVTHNAGTNRYMTISVTYTVA
jgi:hypothetical protein